jgi:hypothetical protein
MPAARAEGPLCRERYGYRTAAARHGRMAAERPSQDVVRPDASRGRRNSAEPAEHCPGIEVALLAATTTPLMIRVVATLLTDEVVPSKAAFSWYSHEVHGSGFIAQCPPG